MSIVKSIKSKLKGIVWTLTTTGVMLVLLGTLTVFGGDILGRLAIGVFVFAIAYVFLYLACKFNSIKKELDKFFK